jgi:hypothetical protein
LFGNRNLHAFSQVFKLLIQLIGFHFLSALQGLKIAAYVLLLTHILSLVIIHRLRRLHRKNIMIHLKFLNLRKSADTI